MKNGQDLFKLFLGEMNIMVSRIRLPVALASEFPDLGLRAHLYGENAPLYDALPEPARTTEGAATVYLMRDRYQCRYILGADDQEAGCCWLIGPYLTAQPTMHGTSALCKKLGVSAEGSRFLHTYYRMLPKLCDENMTESLFRTKAALHYGARGFELVQWDMGEEGFSPLAASSANNAPFQQKFIERTYAIEYKMMDCIAQGNYSGAVALFAKLQGNGMDAKTDNTLRNAKNSLIVFNVLCRVAGYNGGVDPDKLDRWAREFIIRVESATSVKELHPLRDAMIKKYCELARRKDEARYSPVIQKTIDYLDGSFNTDVSLNGLASRFHVSPSYLSTLFKKEIGMPFTEYIIEKRLSFAKQLLLRTNLPVNAIASECGIADSNYFARIFKAQEGVTPGQYRADPPPCTREVP